MKIQLADSPEERLLQLQEFLRAHAKQFNMAEWLGNVNGGTEDWYEKYLEIKSKIRTGESAEAVCQFEACGTTCCIGGAAALLTGNSNFVEAGKYMGLQGGGNYENLNIFYITRWPERLRREYQRSLALENYAEAVEVAIRAIQFFNQYPDYNDIYL